MRREPVQHTFSAGSFRFAFYFLLVSFLFRSGTAAAVVDLVVDEGGDAFVAGVCPLYSDAGTVVVAGMDANGHVLWRDCQREAGEVVSSVRLALDSTHLYYAGDRGLSVVRYSWNGKRTWHSAVDGRPGWSPFGRALSIGPSGGAHVAGELIQQVEDGTSNCITAVYDEDGAVEWQGEYDGPEHYTSGNAVAFDGSGNTLVAATSVPYDGSYEFSSLAVLRYDEGGHGRVMWERPGVVGLDVLADGADSVYVLGWTDLPDQGLTGVLAKLDDLGHTVWSVETPAFLWSAAALGNVEEIFLCGDKHPLADSTWVVASFDSAGQQSWLVEYPGEEGEDTGAYALTTGGGRVAVVGFASALPDSPIAGVTILYDATGNALWTRRLTQAGAYVYPGAVRISPDGNVIAAGVVNKLQSSEDEVFVVAYSPDGTELWRVMLNERQACGQTDDNTSPDDDTAADDESGDNDSSPCGCGG